MGDLGNVEMTQAVNLVDTQWEPIGPDMLISGYLPSSGGLMALEASLSTNPPSLRGPLHGSSAVGGAAPLANGVPPPVVRVSQAPAPPSSTVVVEVRACAPNSAFLVNVLSKIGSPLPISI